MPHPQRGTPRTTAAFASLEKFLASGFENCYLMISNWRADGDKGVVCRMALHKDMSVIVNKWLVLDICYCGLRAA